MNVCVDSLLQRQRGWLCVCERERKRELIHVRERGSKTEAMRHARAAAWRPGPTMDGPYTCGHTAVGIDIAVWRLEEEGGEEQTSGIPRDMDGDAADPIARAQEGARTTDMAQDG